MLLPDSISKLALAFSCMYIRSAMWYLLFDLDFSKCSIWIPIVFSELIFQLFLFWTVISNLFLLVSLSASLTNTSSTYQNPQNKSNIFSSEFLHLNRTTSSYVFDYLNFFLNSLVIQLLNCICFGGRLFLF